MYMKVFPHGKGKGNAAVDYLVRLDYHGRTEAPPEVLRGDTEQTKSVINSINTKWKFTAGVLSWHPEDTVTVEQEQALMEDFEKLAFAGLEKDSYDILWVRHKHANHHELHFVIPRVELGTGKAYNPCPPGWQKYFDVFRDMHNIREEWARPDDPSRARIHTPEHADLHSARLVRYGIVTEKNKRAEAKESIHAYLKNRLEQGLILNRADIITSLEAVDLVINRAGKDYISVKDLESGEKFRLKGGIYAEKWRFTAIASRADKEQDRAGESEYRGANTAAVSILARKFEQIINERSEYNRKRYPREISETREKSTLTLPDIKLDVSKEKHADIYHELLRVVRDNSWNGGFVRNSGKEDSKIVSNSSGINAAERNFAEGHSNIRDKIQRPESLSGRWQGIHSSARGEHGESSRDSRKESSYTTREVKNGRVGVSSQRDVSQNRGEHMLGFRGHERADKSYSESVRKTADANKYSSRGSDKFSRTNGAVLERILARHRYFTERLAKITTIVQHIGKFIDNFKQKARVKEVERSEQKEISKGHGLGR